MTDELIRKKFRKGAIVRPNSLFRTQFKARVTRGMIVGYPRFGRGVIVKWAERKTPQAIHVDYLKLAT